jgi:hypothetical protein
VLGSKALCLARSRCFNKTLQTSLQTPSNPKVLESKALALDLEGVGVQSFSFGTCVGTGLQPVSERLRIAAVSIKLSSWGCKPRPARESMPLSFRGFCFWEKNRNLDRIYRFIFN